jgi:hypothetical protein
MDELHSVMRTLRPETKSGAGHLNVFREFLRHLDSIQRKAPVKPARARPQPRRKPAKRSRGR